MSWCFSCFTKSYEAPDVLELDYRHSTLTEVPAEVFAFERTLEKLHLGSNQITDLPPSLFHCHGLKELDLCDNDLTVIPAAVGSLTRLWRLDLSRNAISEISDSIKNCKSLTQLDLSLNHLVKIPEGVSQLVNLEELFLNDTYLEFLHANFGRLTKLKVLELRENSIQTLPKSMTRLSHLQRLDVGQNDLYEFPEVIGTMTGLTELWCDNNNIRSLSKVIGSLSKLNCLDASSNDIREIAGEISKCSQLVDVTLAMNNLESLPDTFPKLESLSVLRLDSNSIQYLPEDFGNLKSLQELSLIRNLLKALPPSFGVLRKLHTLYLDDNLLPVLPKEIGSCTSLTVLSISKNRLTEIPSEFGHLCNLKVLSLAGNLIVNLPVSILNIPHLWALWLSESQTKPLLQLNQEIDPRTGQHVLTCFLLPQMPYINPELTNGVGAKDLDEGTIPPRRSRPSIKFVTDNDPPLIENNINKRGLLRAPTPYPKELRALAKHASHLRQSRENGDVVNTDEPEYEGDDHNEDDDMETNRTAGMASVSGKDVQRTSLIGGGETSGTRISGTGSTYHTSKFSNGRELFEHKKRSPASSSIGLPEAESFDHQSLGGRASYSGYSVKAGPQVPPAAPPLPVETILSKIEESNKRSAELGSNLGISLSFTEVILPESGADKGSYGNSASELARKSPPPYHVAARRAAFFRSSGTAIPPPSSPRLTPLLPAPTDSSALYIPGVMTNFRHSEKEIDSQDEDGSRIPLLNRTYVVESNDAKESTISVLETEDMTDTPGVKTTKTLETKSEMEKSSSRVLDRGLEREKWLREKSVIESIVKSASEVGNTLESTTTTSNFTTEILTTVKDAAEPEGKEILLFQPLPPVEIYSLTKNYPRSYSSVLPTMPSQISLTKTNSMSTFTASENYSKIPVFSSTKPGLNPEDRMPTSTPVSSDTSSTNQCLTDIVKDFKNLNISANLPPTLPAKPEFLSPGLSGLGSNVGNNVTITTSASRIPKVPSSFSGSNLNNLYNKTVTDDSNNGNLVSNKSADLIGTNNNNSGVSKILPSRIPPSRIPSINDLKLGSGANVKEASKLASGGHSVSSLPVTTITYSYPTNSISTSRIPKLGEVETNSKLVKRTTSGSRIPMKKSLSPQPVVTSSMDEPSDSLQSYSTDGPESDMSISSSQQGSGDNFENQSNSNLAGRKPWIFGTHRNARVVNLEHTKVNGLGFSICNGYPLNSGNDGQGIYIEKVDAKDSRVKVGDKILQVDGIDVVNMTLEIVRKIISNCQETFNLLVSRQN